MLHDVLEWQRAGLGAWLGLLDLGAVTPLGRLLHPSREVLARTLAAGEASDRTLAEAVRADAPFPVRAETVAATPFARLVRLRGSRATRGRFLLMAPHSGYATAVLSPLAALLASGGEVLVTDWIDARLVPVAAGGFGLAEQVALGLAAAAELAGPFHLVALSQAGPAALAVAARLAATNGKGSPVRSLALLGCQLDPALGTSPLQRALAGWPDALLAAQLTTTVGAGYPGAGRRVYPAVLQLLAYSLVSPSLYAEVQGGLWRELATGEGGIYRRQHADLHSLADVPAELFLDMLAWVLGRGPWGGSEPLVAGVAIDAGPLRTLPVLTLESGEDELIGTGQTHALVRHLGLTAARTVTLPQARHHDLFTGPGFFALTAPVLRRFHAAVAAA